MKIVREALIKSVETYEYELNPNRVKHINEYVYKCCPDIDIELTESNIMELYFDYKVDLGLSDEEILTIKDAIKNYIDEVIWDENYETDFFETMEWHDYPENWFN